MAKKEAKRVSHEVHSDEENYFRKSHQGKLKLLHRNGSAMDLLKAHKPTKLKHTRTPRILDDGTISLNPVYSAKSKKRDKSVLSHKDKQIDENSFRSENGSAGDDDMRESNSFKTDSRSENGSVPWDANAHNGMPSISQLGNTNEQSRHDGSKVMNSM